MGFAKRRRSITKVSKGQWAALIVGLFVCTLGGIGGQAKAQVSDLGAPQKQVVAFTFSLGSSELSERYGGNAAAMTQFDKLIQQLAGSSAAHIDSIVVASYASSADQLGNVEVAERRIDAVKAYIEPIIRKSQLRQAVVVTGNVVMKNNIMMPQQMFDLLKRVNVTIYMNGMLTADAGRTVRNRGIGGEEQRYISPFGNGDTDVFGRSTAAKQDATAQKSISTVVAPESTTGDHTNVFPQHPVTATPDRQTQQPQQTETKKTQETTGAANAEQQVLQQQVQVLQQQVQQLQQQLQQQQLQQQQRPIEQPQEPQQQQHPAQQGQQYVPQTQPKPQQGQGVVDSELQRYIDSLAATINMNERAPIIPMTTEVQPTTQAQVQAAPVVAEQQKPVKQPETPVITEEEPCPAERDSDIDDLIRRMLFEEATGRAQTTVSEVKPQQPQEPQQQVEAQPQPEIKPKREVVAFEVVTTTGGEDTEVEAQETEQTKVEKVKPAKEPKVKPVKPVKALREPMVLVRPLVAAKTNLAYWTAVAANLEAEFYFAERWSASIEGVYSNWNMNLYKKHFAVNEISPEVRYWFARRVGEYRGLYLGVYGHLGQFDYMFKDQDTGNTGDYFGAGLSLGAYLPFTRHFGMEIGVRGGWIHAGKYDRYYYDAPSSHYIYKSSHTKDYFGLTGAKVSLVYRFGLGR
ncbi:MAG: DUF3575 domain-containing protein [Rikenella sp.]|nr:DUF3575 domain-containing protein [Rikenella sp.]